MIKSLTKLSIDRTYIKIIKAICEKLTAVLMFYDKKEHVGKKKK
jgi:hypothetical protein